MTHTQSKLIRKAKRHPRCARRRRGAIVVFFAVFIVVAIFTVMWVLNWVWLVLHNRDMQRRSDLLSLVSVVELLDESVLKDAPLTPLDDRDEAIATVDQFVAKNNMVAPATLRLVPANVNVTAGRVENAKLPSFQSTTPYNALHIELSRHTTGLNPVHYLIHGLGTDNSANVATRSVALLDCRIKGFRPTDAVPTPLAPLAIKSSDWFTARPLGGMDTAPANQRIELNAVLRSNSGSSPSSLANSALVDFDELPSFGLSALPDQIIDGIFPSDLNDPALGITTPVTLPARRNSPATTLALVSRFEDVAMSDKPERIFPVYGGSFIDPLTIHGFIGAKVLAAENIGAAGDPQLKVTLEPAFVVHFTAITDPGAQENPYIYKVRLVQ